MLNRSGTHATDPLDFRDDLPTQTKGLEWQKYSDAMV